MFLEENKKLPELKSVRIISTPAPPPGDTKTFDSFDSDFSSDSAALIKILHPAPEKNVECFRALAGKLTILEIKPFILLTPPSS